MTPAMPKLPLRVLVVDDDRDTADTLSALVRVWGYDGRAAYDGEAALRIVATFLPDLLLVDLAMPRLDGCMLAVKLRSMPELAESKLVALSGYTDAEHRQLALEAGFVRFLAKPADLNELQSLLAGTLADRAQQRV